MRHRYALLVGLGLCWPAWADHACVDDLPRGTRVTRTQPMPEAWLKVGDRSVEDPVLHQSLQRAWPKQYVTGWEEGAFGYVCLFSGASHVSIRTDGFGVSASYSSHKPPCEACNEAPGAERRYASGTGLRLGMTKAEASKRLATPVAADATTFEYTSRITERQQCLIRTEILWLGFERDRLARFDISVSREPDGTGPCH